MLTLKPSDFQPAYENQVNFDHPYKTNSIDPQDKNSIFSGPTQKPSQFRSPR